MLSRRVAGVRGATWFRLRNPCDEWPGQVFVPWERRPWPPGHARRLALPRPPAEQSLSASQSGYYDEYEPSGGGYQPIDYTSAGYFNISRGTWGARVRSRTGRSRSMPMPTATARGSRTTYWARTWCCSCGNGTRRTRWARSRERSVRRWATGGGAIHLGSDLGEQAKFGLIPTPVDTLPPPLPL